MKKLLHVGLLLCAVGMSAHQAQVLDRMLAVVNNVAIFQSDWETAVRWESVTAGRSPESMTVTEQRDIFNRLIDRELIREQMKGFALKPIGDNEVKQRLQEVRAEIKGAASDEGWKKLLAENGLSETDAFVQVQGQLELLRFLDVRLRPMVRVDYRTIQNYYRNEYLPALQKQGAKEVPLSEVSDKIREILTQQRLSEQTNIWVDALRQAADIRYPKELAQTK